MNGNVDSEKRDSRRMPAPRHVMRVGVAFAAGAAALTLLTGGVPWVENKSLPSFDGREPLSDTQRADEAYVRGRQSFLQALAFEEKARAASSDGKRRRYEAKAFARFKASADAFEASLKRALKQDYTPDYLPNLYLEMADALFRTRRYEDALQRYRVALEVAPAYLRARYGLARAQLATGHLAQVRETYQALLTEADTRAAAWHYVDALMADVQAWLRDDGATSADVTQIAAMRQWHETQVSELENTVRWTALDAANDSEESR